MISDEMPLTLLRLIEANPKISQRDLASKVGISLGKVNYCVRALIHSGWIKATRFQKSRNKMAYRYLLTARGLEHKALLTGRFLRVKMQQYEVLRAEIEQLRREVEGPGIRVARDPGVCGATGGGNRT